MTNDNQQGAEDDAITSKVKHLRAVEGLSIRQISLALSISKDRVGRIIHDRAVVKTIKPSVVAPYERLIEEWFREHPYLQAQQVYERLKTYGYPGSYVRVVLHTRKYRRKSKKQVYHELTFLPAEEAQVDWMYWRLPAGMVYGFVLLLSYSRYLYVRFYPRCTMEFFLDGHIEAFREMGGVPRKCRYDNLKSVVASRSPELSINAQFMDFCRHYHFGIHPCTVRRPNEKGRVERVIRDIKEHLQVTPCETLVELNKQATLWRQARNRRVHRTTKKPPEELFREEKLTPLPLIPYHPRRSVTVTVGKTGLISFETNRYSVPSAPDITLELLAYPERIELQEKGKTVATHKRSFERNQKIENPLHRERLLSITPNFKYKRIYELMSGMDPCIRQFLVSAEQDGQEPVTIAYELFKLVKQVSKGMLLSAVREANQSGICKISYIVHILNVPHKSEDNPVYPQDQRLLNITYEGRDLAEYDKLK
jgi:transposase